MISNRNSVIILLSFFLVLRIFTVILFGADKKNFADAHSYDDFATTIIISNDWLTNDNFPGSHREPIYPFFITVIYLIFGLHNYLAVYIFQAVISTATIYIIYIFTKKLFSTENKAALFALIWAGFYYFYFKYVGQLIRETLEIFLVVLFFYLLYIFVNRHKVKIKKIIIVGFVFFLLTHLNGKYLFFTPFLFLYFIYKKKLFNGLKYYLIFISFFILFSMPWFIRNSFVYNDKIVVINTRTFEYSLEAKSKNSRQNTAEEAMSFDNITKLNNDSGLSNDEREQLLLGNNPNNRNNDLIKAVRRGKKPAESFLERRLFMFKQFWRITNFSGDFFPYPSGRFNIWSLKHNLLNIVCYAPVLILSIFGFFRIIVRKKIIYTIYLIYPLFITTLLHTFVWSRERYRVPFAAFLIILAGYSFSYLYNLIKNKFDV